MILKYITDDIGYYDGVLFYFAHDAEPYKGRNRYAKF